MRTKKRGIILSILGIIFISLFMISSPCGAQYTGTVVGYGSFFNPAVFSPGSYRLAADYYPVFNPLAALASPFSPILPFTPPPPVIPALSLPATTATVTRTAAQTGTWVGTWTSNSLAYIILWHSGPMTLNIVVDPLFGAVLGTTMLQGSRYTTAPFDVSGVKINNIISLAGIPALGLDTVLTCLLTSPTTMTGFYTVSAKGVLVDEGVFDLNLLAPVLL